jgi:hypothetical protein
MSSLRRVIRSKTKGDFDLRWLGFLSNPLWYVVAIAGLAGLTYYLAAWWWLTGAAALVWGGWLVWRAFGASSSHAGDEEQLQAWLDQACLYKTQINQALKLASADRNVSLYGPSLAAQVDVWTAVIQDLVERLAILRHDDLIRRELATVPQAIAALETQLAGVGDGALRAQLEQALANRRNQLASLRQLQSTLQQAEIQIDNTFSLLSAIYSQILTGQSISHGADCGRFLTDLDEEVRRLQDRLEALREVKGGYRYSATPRVAFVVQADDGAEAVPASYLLPR